MVRRIEPLDQISQWELASELLDQFGIHVGDYLFEQVSAAFDNNDPNGADRWMMISHKIERLATAEGRGVLQ